MTKVPPVPYFGSCGELATDLEAKAALLRSVDPITPLRLSAVLQIGVVFGVGSDKARLGLVQALSKIVAGQTTTAETIDDPAKGLLLVQTKTEQRRRPEVEFVASAVVSSNGVA